MLIAQAKKKENIIEFLLYMFQIEDLMRANSLDLEQIMQSYIVPQIQDENMLNRYREWYSGMIEELISLGYEKSGHVSEITEVQMELFYLHTSLLNLINDEKYRSIYDAAIEVINEFRGKSQAEQLNDVDMAVQALYTKLLLRLKGKDISEETENAFELIRRMLAYLAHSYHKMKEGDLNFINN